MYVTFVMDINVRYISNCTFIWIFYFNMINSKSKTKNVLVIRGSGTLEDPLLLFGEGMKILSSNSDGDGDGDIRKISGMDIGRLVPSPPLLSPSPSLFVILKQCQRRANLKTCPRKLIGSWHLALNACCICCLLSLSLSLSFFMWLKRHYVL